MLIVVEMNRVCFACPSSWDGKTDDGQSLHFKYRYGTLTVWKDSEVNLRDENIIYRQQIGDEMDGVLDYDDLRRAMLKMMMFICDEKVHAIDPNDGYDVDAFSVNERNDS